MRKRYVWQGVQPVFDVVRTHDKAGPFRQMRAVTAQMHDPLYARLFNRLSVVVANSAVVGNLIGLGKVGRNHAEHGVIEPQLFELDKHWFGCNKAPPKPGFTFVVFVYLTQTP